MDKLKPCPFCNGTHSINVINFFTRDSFRKCDICGAEAPEAKTPEESAKVWNTRPAEDALKAEIERLKSRWEKLKDFCEGEEYFSSMFYGGAYRNVLNKIEELGEDTDVTTKESEVKE